MPVMEEVSTEVRYRDMAAEPFTDMSREAGIRWPVYMSKVAYEQVVEVSPDAPGHHCQDTKGRYWDVLMCFRGTRHDVDDITSLFAVLVRDRDNRQRPKTLKALMQLDVDGDPFLIFMLPSEE